MGALLVHQERTKPHLAAVTVVAQDTDQDGLCDKLERVLGTSRVAVDTDGDGFGDGEELCRQTSPLFGSSLPSSRRVSVGMSACGSRDKIDIAIGLYAKGVSISDLNVTVGIFASNRIIELSNSYVASHSHLQLLPTSDPFATNALLVFRIPPSAVHALGALTLFATVSNPGSGIVASADTVQLTSIAGNVVLVMPDPTVPPVEMMMVAPGAVLSVGSIYVPLPLGSNDDMGYPATWVPDSVCYQRTSPTAVDGAVVTQEVVQSECRDGWDGACAPSCTGAVGSTFTTVDPLVLVGG